MKIDGKSMKINENQQKSFKNIIKANNFHQNQHLEHYDHEKTRFYIEFY